MTSPGRPQGSGPCLAHFPALDEVDDAEQDHRADEGDEQADDRELLDAADDPELVGNEIADDRTDTADHDVPENAHRGIAVHDLAGQPAGNTANDQCYNPSHMNLLSVSI
ncbi:hypothetical protein SPHV1_2270046 [Novosphingobium sp. KN65.2]|nr:hypothetical protein SPHV1_2270046 [Novosphingobium sp. KN65.2]